MQHMSKTQKKEEPKKRGRVPVAASGEARMERMVVMTDPTMKAKMEDAAHEARKPFSLWAYEVLVEAVGG